MAIKQKDRDWERRTLKQNGYYAHTPKDRKRAVKKVLESLKRSLKGASLHSSSSSVIDR